VPVDVHIPIKLKVGPLDGSTDMAGLEGAVGNAVRRACEHSRREVLEPRGSRPLIIQQPRITFTSNSDPLDDTLRGEISKAIEAGLRTGIGESGIVQGAAATRTPAGASGQSVQEVVDRDRYDPAGGMYLVPVYDDGGNPRTFPVDDQNGSPSVGQGLPTEYEALARALEASDARNNGVPWNPAQHGYPGYYGSYTTPQGGETTQLIYLIRFSRQGNRLDPDDYQFGSIQIQSHIPRRENDRIVVGHSTRHLNGRLLRLENTRERVTREALISHLEGKMDPSDDRRRIAEAVADSMLANDGDSQVFWRLSGGTETLTMPGPEHLSSPVVFIVGPYRRADGTMTGGGGGADASRQGGSGQPGDGGGAGGGVVGGSGTGDHTVVGGPMGTGEAVEGEGTIWPYRATNGTPLVCEPFLGEPPVIWLKARQEEVERRMRYFNTILGVPYCGWAGQFCLNVAKTIGGRAHDIGVLSRLDEASTTVQTFADGGGNNGLVDIQPAVTPTLQYMRLLGRLARELSEFSNTLYDVYTHPANRHLVYANSDRDYEPDAVLWCVRFLAELNGEIINSCMWCFAETCRVILLQQLRSSAGFIAERRRRFAETKANFDAALDIMGSSIVRLQVLQRAIRFGPDPYIYEYIDSGRMGGHTIRQRRQTERLRNGDYIGEAIEQYVASIRVDRSLFDSIRSARIVRRGDRHVAVWKGRDWTTEDLDQARSLRRSLLNMADPLFYQVENFDLLIRRYQRDPDFTEYASFRTPP